jgi:hypothetical protein
MSIFVDAGKRFELKINCNIVKNDDGDVICYKIDPNGKSEISCDVKGRNFEDMSNIIEEATIINSVTGNPLLRTSILCKLIVSNFFSSIRIKDIDEEEVEVYYPDIHSVSHMRYELVKALSKKWLEMTSGK